jgi:hypothetical protein
MLSTEEMIMLVTRNMFAKMKEDETDSDILQKIICFLMIAYESTLNLQDNTSAIA